MITKSEEAKYLAYLYEHHDGAISRNRLLQSKDTHRVDELIRLGMMHYEDKVYTLNAIGYAVAETLEGRVDYNKEDYGIIFDEKLIMKAAHKSRWLLR